MASRVLPRGLRAQLAVAIALVTALALGLSFLAVYRGTGARLRDRIDEDLSTQVAEWDQLRAATAAGDARTTSSGSRGASSTPRATTRRRGSSSSTWPAASP